ncbi:hypothetical protein BV502_01040 [Leucobacter sp. OAMLP11]|nr:hypothetical protein BV502_01040 [Leucobacter sp. OAMLP11]
MLAVGGWRLAVGGRRIFTFHWITGFSGSGGAEISGGAEVPDWVSRRERSLRSLRGECSVDAA